MDPMVTGIYAASPERLSVRSALPRIKNMEALHGSLFRGMLAVRNCDKAAALVKQGPHSLVDGAACLELPQAVLLLLSI